MLAFIAYVIVAGAFATRRISGQWTDDRRYFRLGKAGIPIAVAAVVWGVAMIINIGWPRQAVYNPVEPFHWYLQWGAVLFVVIALAAGFLYYWFVQRHKIGILAEHASGELDPLAIVPASDPVMD